MNWKAFWGILGLSVLIIYVASTIVLGIGEVGLDGILIKIIFLSFFEKAFYFHPTLFFSNVWL